MASYNRVILMGNLTRDPEVRTTPGGVMVADLRLAVNETFRDKTTNAKVEKACFVDVAVWDQSAEICRQYLTKGSPLLVEGRLQYDEWKTPQGETRNKLRVRADRIQLVGGGQRPGGAPSPEASTASSGTPPVGGYASAPAASQHEPEPGYPAASGDPSNDDPPF